jgi:hypothetical protein
MPRNKRTSPADKITGYNIRARRIEFGARIPRLRTRSASLFSECRSTRKVRTSRLASKQSRKLLSFTPVWESSGEFRIKRMRD